MSASQLTPTQLSTLQIGLGNANYQIAIYLENIPPLTEYQQLTELRCITSGEISYINQSCGNGWRKVFNVYAKVLFALNKKQFHFHQHATSWQNYRDQFLLQKNSDTAMFFSAIEDIKTAANRKAIRLITGKGYAKKLSANNDIALQLEWLDDEFAIDRQQRVIVCPYFDYRQLSNVKIIRLVELVDTLF